VWWERLGRVVPLPLHWFRLDRFWPATHRRFRWRKQLAALLSVRYGLAPGGLALLLEDDAVCRRYLARFLAEHQVAYPFPLYDEQGRYLLAAPHKLEVLTRALLSAVAKGKDNELFVLLVDLLEAGPELTAVERAVTLALARHHQVLVICPWPDAVPLPARAGRPARRSRIPTPTRDRLDLLLRADTARLHQQFARVQHAFGRLGVPVLCAAADDTAQRVLSRIQRIRMHSRGGR
jgi:hypothetical protein